MTVPITFGAVEGEMELEKQAAVVMHSLTCALNYMVRYVRRSYCLNKGVEMQLIKALNKIFVYGMTGFLFIIGAHFQRMLIYEFSIVQL